MQLIINGQARVLAELRDGSTVADLVAVLAMQADRVALEQNGSLVSRTDWGKTFISAGDRLEIVHFVGGGTR
jgi:sulfur carrier protein